MNRNQFIHQCIFIFLAMLIVAGCSQGTPEITATDAQFIPSQMLIGKASAFMKIVNKGTGSDTLRGCSLKEYPSVRGEIHNIIGGKMTQINQIDVPAGHNVDLKMGGYHLMFFGIPEEIGDAVTLVLSFQKSGAVEVAAAVGVMTGHGMNH